MPGKSRQQMALMVTTAIVSLAATAPLQHVAGMTKRSTYPSPGDIRFQRLAAKLDLAKLVTPADAARVLGHDVRGLNDRSKPGSKNFYIYFADGGAQLMIMMHSGTRYTGGQKVSRAHYVVEPLTGIGDKAVLFTRRPQMRDKGQSFTLQLFMVKGVVEVDLEWIGSGTAPTAANINAFKAVARTAASRLP